MVRLPLSPNAGFASDRSALRMPPKSVFVDVVVGGLLRVLRQFHPGLFGVLVRYISVDPNGASLIFLRNGFRATL